MQTVASVTDVAKKPLTDKTNLSFSSSCVTIEGQNYLIGTLSHSSGEWIRTFIPLIADKMDMQKMGSAISYARRYALSSLCHIATEDDDGESTVNRVPGSLSD